MNKHKHKARNDKHNAHKHKHEKRNLYRKYWLQIKGISTTCGHFGGPMLQN